MTGSATMLLPSDLLGNLSQRQRTTLLLHELVHLARRDPLVRWVELAALGLYWWHPVAWWARRNLERAEELCCDARVVGMLPESARAYAETLLATVEFLAESRSALPLGASGFSHVHHLTRRMEMILATNVTRRVGWPLRLTLLAIGLAVLPLSIHALQAEPANPGGEATDAPSTEASNTEETRIESAGAASSDEEEISVAKKPSAEKEAPDAPSSVERRLDRLEKMIQSLVEQKQGSRAAKEKQIPSPAAVTIDVDSPAVSKMFEAPLENIDHEFGVMIRQATLNLELVKTNSKRRDATIRQCDAVATAYESGAVTLDQLLEAQRRAADADISYARTVCDLCGDPTRRHYLFALASLEACNRALKGARETWKKIHARATPGSTEEKAEAQVREQYFQFKTQTQSQLDELIRAKAAVDGNARRTPTKLPGILSFWAQPPRHRRSRSRGVCHRKASGAAGPSSCRRTALATSS